MRTATVAVLAVAALTLTACSDSTSAESNGEVNDFDAAISSQIDEAVQAAMQYSGSDEALVGIWSGDAASVSAYGEGVSADSRFRAAQTSQPMLCALLLELAADGVVALDDPVSEDLPRQVGIDGITYEQLCTATSGLADFKQGFADLFTNNPSRPWSDRELFAQGLARSPLSWPGKDVHVSDTDYLLLARALPVVAGAPLNELLDEHVFAPQSMSESRYPLEFTELTVAGGSLDGLSYPSAGGAPVCEAGTVEVPEVSLSMLSGAGGVTTSLSDLKTFYSSYLEGAYGENSVERITATVPAVNPARDEAGNPTEEVTVDANAQRLGFGIEQFGPLYGMSGSITGTMTASYHDPASDFTVVVVLNNASAGTGFVRTLAFQLAAIAAEGGSGPELGWTAADQAAALAAGAICQPAA